MKTKQREEGWWEVKGWMVRGDAQREGEGGGEKREDAN